MKYSKFIVALVIILNVIFTTAVLYVFYHTSVEPVALIAGWFAFTTGELWFLSGITKIRIKEGDDDE
jgi:hypothetical protein